MTPTAVEYVAALVGMPDRLQSPPEDPAAKWDGLTRSAEAEFVKSLRAVIHAHAAGQEEFDRWERALLQWERGYGRVNWWNSAAGRDRTKELKTARSLLSAARRVALKERPPSPPGVSGLQGSPDSESAYEAWFAAAETEAAGSRVRRVVVPVALYDETVGKGFLAKLTLELLDGHGCARHPEEAFVRFKDSFAEGIADAFEGALTLRSPDAGASMTFSLLWRVQANDPARGDVEPGGRSASGAAGLGLVLALDGKVPDQGVLVIAEIDQANKTDLRPVAPHALDRKVKAVAEEYDRSPSAIGQIDTIVVAEEGEKKRCEVVLDEHFRAGTPSRSSPIRVLVA